MNVLYVLFPRVRAEIIRLLFVDAEKAYHLRELARQSALAIGTVQSEVKKLAEAQIITGRREGNRLYYQANGRHPLFPELRQLAVKTAGLHEALAAAFRDLKGIQAAFIFGSVAAGAARPDSDVDLFFLGSVSLEAIVRRLTPLYNSQDREINPIAMTPAKLAEQVKLDGFAARVLAGPKLWIVGGPGDFGGLVEK